MGHPTDPTDDPMIPNHQMFFFSGLSDDDVGWSLYSHGL